ncbi:DNA replication terminus site-binding protein [Reinekea marina]|uniref:DNA replication terminus site-binding protein n=1 Tax=Reinekea marina TaxID=1310421 RepID=A0ABV7WT74_9GAMM|nr:DNA replication terminus site-binding protein [Reinekea marina]MDN3649714.1 DNA replication terminus site-binding protein [Reinekea marina]
MEAQLYKQFEALRDSMRDFSRMLSDDRNTLWLAPWNHLDSRSTIEDILFDLWYQDDQDGRETRVYPGLVGITPHQITYANEINLAKDRFRKTVQKIKADDSAFWRDVQGRLAKRYKTLNDQLTRDGLARIHLKQVFRHLPLVVSRPEKVGFSWYTSGRSIQKITTKDAYDLLCKLNTESAHIQIQLERLAALPSNEPLARVQKQAPVLRANIVFANKQRRSLNVSLPLLFPNEGQIDLPDFNIPPQTPPAQRQRLVRSDNRIEDEAYLPSIRVHRYAQQQKTNFF